MIEMRDGDLLKQDDVQMYIHQVNCQGVMRSGIAKQIREEFPDNFIQYRNMVLVFNESHIPLLGNTLVCYNDEKNVWIANMFSQEFYGYDGQQYTDYIAFDSCMKSVYENAVVNNIHTVGLPYGIGCVRGGAIWENIYSIIEYYFKDSDIKCVICKL